MCGPVATPVYPPAGYAANAAPSRLNVSPAVADVTVIVPVATVQVGSTCVNVGAVGVAGCAAIVMLAAGDVQPAAFCAVRV